MRNEKEIRGISYRATVDEESRHVEGYALLFNTDSRPMWGGDLIERIAPTALDGVLERSDVLCLMNHDESRGVLARWREGDGSLSLTVDEKGLRYAFEAPKTALGDELIEALKRGDIAESSFAFTVEKDNWERNEDGTYMRTIVQIRQLYDVSPVYYWNDNNFRAIRLSDMLLLYAECVNEVNHAPDAKAIECLNRVRSRAGLPD